MAKRNNLVLQLIILFLITICLNAQTVNELNAEIDSLNSVLKNSKKSIPENNILFCNTQTANIYKEPEAYRRIGITVFGREVELIEILDEHYKIKSNNVAGYVSKEYFSSKEEFEIKKIIRKLRNEKDNKIKEKLIEKYGNKYGADIFYNRISLGMTKQMVIESIGKPKDTNKTIGSWGTHEQWVYRNKYLYFENGILTSWQE